MEDINPLVSVCMPAYNAEKYIGEAIASVIAQTYQNWELIIVNDGSADATLAVAKQFRDSRIKIITQENKGQCAAANRAFVASTGALIKFFDADDILSPAMLAAQVKLLRANEENVASTRWGRFYNDDISTFKLNPEPVWRNMESSEWLVESWEDGMPMMQCALWLIPRNIVLKAGLWDERLSLINDFDFFSRIVINSKMVVFADDATLYYRSGIASSLSATKSAAAYQSAYLSLAKGINTLLQTRTDIRAKTACANLWQLLIYEIYPGQPDLVDRIELHMEKLPRPGVEFPAGGLSKLLLPVLGWRTVKRLQRFKIRIKSFGRA